MNPKSIELKKYELKSIWNSFEWLIEEKLIAIDNNVRSMIMEMKTMGIPEWMIMEQLPKAFENLKQKVVEAQCLKYDGTDNLQRKGRRLA